MPLNIKNHYFKYVPVNNKMPINIQVIPIVIIASDRANDII